ncbi:sugar ABC transporter substrate-binding protein [Actinoplanes italicus]|uniref:Monosaccharide ABC transporter substrate-binding protein (CUT2 family) n=1 Tax=Actinoplanes italicus TaxID=113567 RepID=A0A2T0K963_9ACTN|nr:substrate-binding domain-containing protein [Actinoplanes italicus]PRX19591.1 monosaccharide ABC transporter substrate-binding protein (CUT2 family) [Actinoplanes italicus]GIE30398.1 sugar ABC transporter substrate-binding protein [Actinoplanes italicus]
MKRSPFLRLGIGAALISLVATAGCTRKSDNEAATASTGKGPDQVKVALIPGGAHPYFQPWKTAAADVKTEFKLGDATFNETSGWDQTKQNDVVKSLAAQGYNAFGIFGVAPENINSTFEDLKRQGFPVASLASCPAGDVNKADFCLSTDVEEAAYKATKAAIETIGGKGNLAHLTGNKVDSNTQRRIAGVEKAVGETGGQVKIIQVVTDIDTDLQTAQKAVADLLAAKGSEITAIVNTAYNPAVASAEGVKQAKLPIKVIAIDDDKTILDGIKDGSVAGTVLQNPVGQATVGSYGLMKLAGGCTMADAGVIVDSGSFVVTKANVDSYETDRKAKTAELRQAFDSQYLTCR